MIKSSKALPFLSLMGAPFSEAAACLILADDSSSDSVGVRYSSAGISSDTFDMFGGFVPIDVFSARTSGCGDVPLTVGSGGAALWAQQSGQISFIDSYPYQTGGIFAFRSDERLTIPSTRRTQDSDEDFFSFLAGDGFVEGSDNFTRIVDVERVGTGINREWVDVNPFWVQWNVEFDDQNQGIAVTPLAVLLEDANPLTPRQAAIAIGAIPEPTSIFQLVLGVVIAGFRRRR